MGTLAGGIHYRHIHSTVPFSRAIHTWLHYANPSYEYFIRESRDYEARYLAWETVRKGRNPFFVKGTGLEGYLVGRCTSPEEALTTILGIAQTTLDRIARYYRYNWEFRARLLRVLRRECDDPQGIAEWSAQLGAMLGVLRCHVLRCPEAQHFQTQTYLMTTCLPRMDYAENGDHLDQSYAVIDDPQLRDGRLSVDLAMLNPAQQEAWIVADAIGEFGHPLIREYLALRGG